MELRHLRYFLAVAEERNFTRAASRLGISQPPLSQQIRDLEEEIGVPLFDRLPQGVELTEAGRAFRKQARVTIEQAERAMQFARRAGTGVSGLLRVGITSTASFNPVPPAMLRCFRVLYPDVAITIEEDRSIRLVERLLTDELDVTFVRPSPAFPQGLEMLTFGRETLAVALPENHPLAEDQAVTLARLASDPFILIGKSACASFHSAVIEACRSAGFDPVIGQQAARLTSIPDLVAGGFGVALVPQSVARLGVNGVVYRNLDGDPPSVPLALAARDKNTSSIITNFFATGRALSSQISTSDQ